MDTQKRKELVRNRKARFEYEILDKLEVGIVLRGTEIKSLRANGGSLQEAYVYIEQGELWLVNASIAPYKQASFETHSEKRRRKLLAHKKEIRKLQQGMDEKGLTCVPLCLYLKKGKAKLEIALARGKKVHDKRASIKEREDKRAISRAMKQF